MTVVNSPSAFKARYPSEECGRYLDLKKKKTQEEGDFWIEVIHWEKQQSQSGGNLMFCLNPYKEKQNKSLPISSFRGKVISKLLLIG